MNSTTSISDIDIVQRLSDEKTRLLVPLIVWLALLLVTGVIGNILVIIYYGFVSKLSTNTFFIVVLATYDLVFCTSVPIEICDIMNYYTFTNGAACKSFRFITYVCSFGSGLNLIAIAFDRYKRICKPCQVQWIIKRAKAMSVVFFFLSLLFTCPAVVLYDSHEIPLMEQNGSQIIGRDCTVIPNEEYKLYVRLYNGIKFILFIITTVIICVLYSIIGRAIYRQWQVLARYKKTVIKECIQNVPLETIQRHEQLSQTNETSDLPYSTRDIVCETSGIKMSSFASDVNNDRIPDVTEPRKGTYITPNTSGKAESVQQTGINNETIMITVVMIVITGVFVLSFLPYLTMVIWRIHVGRREEERMSSFEFVAYNFGARSYVLNSAVNPWIYGIFNRNFRYYLYRKLCRKY